eukprot:482485-Ditylum_brightwellii.AAC.1
MAVVGATAAEYNICMRSFLLLLLCSRYSSADLANDQRPARFRLLRLIPASAKDVTPNLLPK